MNRKIGIFVILVIGILASIYFWNMSQSSKIVNYTMDIDANVDGSVRVKEIKEYNFVKDNNDLILGFAVIDKNISIEKFNTSFFINNITKLFVKVECDGKVTEMSYNRNSSKEDNIDMSKNIVLLSNNLFGFKVDGNYNKGDVRVTFEYSMSRCVVKYIDKTQIYLNISEMSNIYDIDNLQVNLSLYNKVNNTNVDVYEYSKKDIASEQLSSKNITLQYYNLYAGSNVQARILYDSDLSSRLPFVSGYIQDRILQDTNKYNELNRVDSILQKISIVLIIAIFIYWIYLLIKYDFNKLISTSFPSYEEIVDSVNPILAACIIDEREIEFKDLIACLVGLSARKVIDIESIPRKLYDEKLKDINMNETKEYIECLKDKNVVFVFRKNEKFWENKKSIDNLDEIDRQVIELFFREKEEFVLDFRLNEIKNDYLSELKIKGINDTINHELDKLDANIPMKTSVKILNKVIFALVVIFITFQIVFNIYSLSISSKIFSNYTFGFWGDLANMLNYLMLIGKSLIIVGFISMFLEVIIYFSYFVILFIERSTGLTLKFIKKENPNFNSKIYLNSIAKVTKMAGKIFAICTLGAVIIFIFVPSYKVFIFSLLITFSLIIVITDDYMYKHSDKLNKLYLGINILQNKIGYGSLLKEKNLKDTILWNKYLAFSLAFGISNIEDYTKILKEKTDVFEDITNYVLNKQLYIDLLESFIKRGQ